MIIKDPWLIVRDALQKNMQVKNTKMFDLRYMVFMSIK
jgi:hypothetical protein